MEGDVVCQERCFQVFNPGPLTAAANQNCSGCAGFVIPFGHTPNTLDEFMKKWSEMASALKAAEDPHGYHLHHSADSFQLYIDVVVLLRQGVFKNALDAETKLGEFHINRKKLAKVQTWWGENAESDLKEVPVQFLSGRTHKGTLTPAQKRDVLKHVEVMQRSNCVFSSKDLKKCIWRFYLVNIGAVRADDSVDWHLYEQYEKSKDLHSAPRAYIA